MNCYHECKYNYYFDINDNYKYTCTKTNGCPKDYRYLFENTKQCSKSCNDKNQYIFRNTCFKKQPNESKNCTQNRRFYYCNAFCPIERPFEMTETQYCVSSCTIMERYNKLCITNYDDDKNNEVQDMVLSDFKDDIVDTFDYRFIIENSSIIHEEKKNIFEITSTNFTYQDRRTTFIDLDACESILKKYYKIDINETLYIFKVDAFVEGKA